MSHITCEHVNKLYKADDVLFFSLSNLPTKLVPHVIQVIDCTLKGQFYSEFGFDTK